MTIRQQRSVVVDGVRFAAIVMMVVYHFFYDLDYFGFVDLAMNQQSSWISFRYVILSGFCLSAGMSLYLVHHRGIRWQILGKRTLRLVLASVLVTLVSLVLFAESWIYFGVLHFFVVASLFAVFFVRLPWLALGAALLLFVEYVSNGVGVQGLFSSLRISLGLPERTEDLVPLLPWLAVLLLGVFCGSLLPKLRQTSWLFAHSSSLAWLCWSSRHSLLIYLVHQPILFALIYPVYFFAQ